MLRIFTPVKIQRLRPGLNAQTWVPEASIPYRNCMYNRLTEDEPSGSRHVEDKRKLKIEILI